MPSTRHSQVERIKHDQPSLRLSDRSRAAAGVADKPVVHVGTIGHVDHGKTTLTSAITLVQASDGLACERPFASLDKRPEERRRGVTISNGYCTFDTERYRYVHVDCPGHVDYIDEMIVGAAQMNAAILVVSAIDGPMPQTLEHLLLAHQAGVNDIVVFLSMMDRIEDIEEAEIIEEETRTLLDRCGYDGGTVPVVRGDARAAMAHPRDPTKTSSIVELLSELDRTVSIPSWDADGPFFMPITESFSIQGRGTVLTGRIDRGTVRIGDELEVSGGLAPIEPVKAKAIECFRQSLTAARAGDLIGILVSGVSAERNRRGRVLSVPRGTRLHDFFWADIRVLKSDEGGRSTPIENGFQPYFHLRTGSVTGELMLPKRHRKAPPGDSLSARVKLFRPAVLEVGWNFSARDGGCTVLLGTIREFID